MNKYKELQNKKESKFRKIKNRELNSKIGSIEHPSEKVMKVSKSGIINK